MTSYWCSVATAMAQSCPRYRDVPTQGSGGCNHPSPTIPWVAEEARTIRKLSVGFVAGTDGPSLRFRGSITRESDERSCSELTYKPQVNVTLTTLECNSMRSTDRLVTLSLLR
jgi:hypothetical protein